MPAVIVTNITQNVYILLTYLVNDPIGEHIVWPHSNGKLSQYDSRTSATERLY